MLFCMETIMTPVSPPFICLLKFQKTQPAKSGEAADARSFESITSPVYCHHHTGANFMQTVYHTVIWPSERSQLQSDGWTGASRDPDAGGRMKVRGREVTGDGEEQSYFVQMTKRGRHSSIHAPVREDPLHPPLPLHTHTHSHPLPSSCRTCRIHVSQEEAGRRRKRARGSGRMSKERRRMATLPHFWPKKTESATIGLTIIKYQLCHHWEKNILK